MAAVSSSFVLLLLSLLLFALSFFEKKEWAENVRARDAEDDDADDAVGCFVLSLRLWCGVVPMGADVVFV